MTTIVERMARVICETQNVDGFKCTCPLAGEPKGNDWCNGNRAIAQARAALLALADNVTDEMMIAFCENYPPTEQFAPIETVKAKLRKAMSAALSRAARGEG